MAVTWATLNQTKLQMKVQKLPFPLSDFCSAVLFLPLTFPMNLPLNNRISVFFKANVLHYLWK